MSKQKAMYWPYGIAVSFVLIITLIVGTIIVAGNNKVEDSDLFMQNYHVVDENVNDILFAQIAFNKKYTITYVTEKLSIQGSTIAYRLVDTMGTPVQNATFEVVVTRPNTHAHNMTLTNPEVNAEGVYTFPEITLPLEGRWDIMARVTVGEDYRYYNLKADTRYTNTFEY